MMKKYLFTLLIFILPVATTYARTINCPGISFSENEINITSQHYPPGEVISRMKTGGLCKLGAAAWWYKFRLLESRASTGLMYNDGEHQYAIYRTGIPGVGYIFSGYWEGGYAIGGYHSGTVALSSPSQMLWDSGWNIISWAKVRPAIQLVTTGENIVLPGDYNDAFEAAHYTIDSNKVPISLRLRFGVAAQSCTPSSKSYTSKMGTLSSTAFSGVNSTVSGSPFTITITCKEPNVGVSGVFSDFSNLSNTSEYLNLTPDSSARGVKAKLTYDGVTVKYAPPSEAGYSEHSVVFKSPTSDLTQTFSVTPAYVQTENVLTGGTANAIAVITFVYD